MVLLTFFRLWVSEADRKTAASTGAGGVARPAGLEEPLEPLPVRHQRHVLHAGAREGAAATRSAESASAGIHLGDTKLVASMREMPASTSAAMSASLPAVGTTRASFCSPSRGPTS